MYAQRRSIGISKGLRAFIACITAFLMVFSGINIDVYADTTTASYYDRDAGAEKTVFAEVVTADMTTWGEENAEKWYVVKGNITMNETDRVTVKGAVHLILEDSAVFKADSGIDVSAGNSLTIYGQSENVTSNTGKIEVIAKNNYAVIGGSDGKDGGTITITGGDINVRTYQEGAGIGGGKGGSGGIITITGGKVTAKHSGKGAAIGGGSGGDGGTITIDGGAVTANSHNQGAAIGGGENGAGGTITINGGAVTANSHNQGAGIGGGSGGSGSKINISGGEVNANSEAGGAGIGGGIGGDGGKITITGGVVNASTIDKNTPGLNTAGAAIGGGMAAAGGTITISGGVVNARANGFGAGIGGGGYGYSNAPAGAGGTVTISGGEVTATSKEASGIGGGLGEKGNQYNEQDGDAGTFSTTVDGTALIKANSIADTSGEANWKGTIFNGNDGKVCGSQQLTDDLTVDAGKTLTVTDGSELTVPEGKTLTIGGTLENNGKITNNGTIENNSPIKNTGEIKNTGTIKGEITNEGSGKVFQRYPVPKAAVDYDAEKLTGLNPDISYKITVDGDAEAVRPSADGKVDIKASWFGKTLSIAAQASGDYLESEPQILSIPSRPGASTNNSLSEPKNENYTIDDKQTAIKPEKSPDLQAAAEITLKAKEGDEKTAIAEISKKTVENAIKKAKEEAKKNGKEASGISLELKIDMPKGMDKLRLNLTEGSLEKIASKEIKDLTISSRLAKTVFDKKTISEIRKQAKGDVVLSITPGKKLSKEAEELIGKRPVYDIGLSYGSGKKRSDFGNGTITVFIPYKPEKNEAISGLYAVYVDEKEKGSKVDGSAYDVDSEAVLFTTNHLSVYGVGYTAPSEKFDDIKNHWAKDSIDYVVGRGLLKGMTDNKFYPNNKMTRGMLVTALGRLAGVNEKNCKTNSFGDVKNDSPYRPYIEWAHSKGVIYGIGDERFAPDRNITREEVAVIFERYGEATGYNIPEVREASIYEDEESIGTGYRAAVKTMQQAGIMMGMKGNKFNPKGNATRAEVSAMLSRYLKLTVSPETAQGFVLDDAGKYRCYKDGKALTGKQTLDGAVYFFDESGALQTGWVKDGKHWRYYDGAKAHKGWLSLNVEGFEQTYYLNGEGLLESDKWVKIDGKQYYFYPDGRLAVNTEIDGYKVDSKGVREEK